MENANVSSVGQKIKVLRKTRGLTQQQLADKLDIQRATISNYEIGRRSPHLKELEKIASVLGVNIDYFAIGDATSYDLISRAKLLFENEEISAAEKANIYKEIMRLYLKIEE